MNNRFFGIILLIVVLLTTNGQLLTIRQIKELSSVEYRDLYFANPNGKQKLVPGFIITYGPNNNILYMTSADPYFDEFVRKVREVYQEEKDHVISEGIMGKQYIQIDDLTKSMLINGELESTSELYKEYAKEYSYQESLLMEEDKVKALFPVIEYHLKETLERWETRITDIKLSGGVNGVYYLNAKVNQKPSIIPIYFEPKEDGWKVTLGNLFERSIPLQIEGHFSTNGIFVSARILEYEYEDDTFYQIRNNRVWKEREIYQKERMIHYETKDLPVTSKKEPQEVYEMDASAKKIEWYELPWNSYLGLYEDKWYMTDEGERQEEESPHRMVENKIIYLSKTQDTIWTKEIASKRYHRKKDDRTVGGNIQLDYMNKRRIGKLTKDAALVETHFTRNGVTGKYKEALSGKYFYQIYQPDLTKEKARFIDQNDQVDEKTDLFDPKQYIKETM